MHSTHSNFDNNFEKFAFLIFLNLKLRLAYFCPLAFLWELCWTSKLDMRRTTKCDQKTTLSIMNLVTLCWPLAWRECSTKEPLLKGKAQYNWPPCANFFLILQTYFTLYKTSSLNEANRTEPSLSVRDPWFNKPASMVVTLKNVYDSF